MGILQNKHKCTFVFVNENFTLLIKHRFSIKQNLFLNNNTGLL